MTVALFRKAAEWWSTKSEEVIESLRTSRVTEIALCFQRLLSEDMTPEAGAELIRVAAGSDTLGLAEFARKSAQEAEGSNDPLLRYVTALFLAVADDKPLPSPDPADAALFPAIRRMDAAPTPEEAASELVDRSPELNEVIRLVQNRSWDPALSTKKVAAELDRYIGDRLGRNARTNDRLLQLDFSRRVFLDFLLSLTGREPEDRDD
jgi:hypothetical protein